MKIERIECKLKIPPPRINLSEPAIAVGEMVDNAFSPELFDKAIKYLKGEGITGTTICAEAGIPRQCLREWRLGIARPVDPYYMLLVREWARLVQENREKCEQEFNQRCYTSQLA